MPEKRQNLEELREKVLDALEQDKRNRSISKQAESIVNGFCPRRITERITFEMDKVFK